MGDRQAPIRLAFADFWDDFPVRDNYFLPLFEKVREVEIVTESPDVLVFSCFGNLHRRFTDFDCVKIFYSGENIVPNFNECDYAIGFDAIEFGDRYLRQTYFQMPPGLRSGLERRQWTKTDLPEKSRFCGFVYSNKKADPIRDRFFYSLSKYRKVDSPGRHLRNVESIDSAGGADFRANKLPFLAQCKFAVAFENSTHPGYTTEKVYDALLAQSVPIYWGNPLICIDVNPEAFINAHDFDSIADLVAEVRRVDLDDDAYLQMLNARPFAPGAGPTEVEVRLEQFIRNIVTQPPGEGRRRPRYGRARGVEVEHRFQLEKTKWTVLKRTPRNVARKILVKAGRR